MLTWAIELSTFLLAIVGGFVLPLLDRSHMELALTGVF
jgi:hypothetical protein